MTRATANEALPLRCLAGDGAAGLYPVARVYSAVSTLVATVNLTHIAEGLYGGSWTPTTVGHVTSVFTVYSDAARTLIAGYDLEGDEIEVTPDPIRPHEVLDQCVYNTGGLMTSGRLRIFPTAADAAAGTNAIATFAVGSTASAAPSAHLPASTILTRTS